MILFLKDVQIQINSYIPLSVRIEISMAAALQNRFARLGLEDDDESCSDCDGNLTEAVAPIVDSLRSKTKTNTTAATKSTSKNQHLAAETEASPTADPNCTTQSSPKKSPSKAEFLVFFNLISEYLDKLSGKEVLKLCSQARLSTKKKSAKLRGELKAFFKTNSKIIFNKMSWVPHHIYPLQFQYNCFNNQYFDYLVVIDFEATCFQDNPPSFQHEIIQFPAVLIHVPSRMPVDEFNIYCKPKLNPILSDFCTKLTGITQDQVDNAPEFDEALDMFNQWLMRNELGSRYRFAIVCDGAWDMGKFLHTQCEISKVKYPSYAYRWINIRKSFSNFYSVKWFNLRIMLGLIGQPFQGRPHDGLDDSKNIGNIVLRLLYDGCILMENERILLAKEDQEKNAVVQLRECSPYSLCTVENLSRAKFVSLYKFSGVPLELDPVLGKENIVCVSAAVGNNKSDDNGSADAPIQNRKRSKPKFRKFVEAKDTAEKKPEPPTTIVDGMIVVSARILEE